MAKGATKAAKTSGGTSLKGTIALLLVLVLAGGGVAVWRYDLLDGRLDELLGKGPSDDDPTTPGPDAPTTDPAIVAPPPGLELPPVEQPGPVADPAPGGRLDPAAVRRALRPFLSDKVLGRHVLAAVAPLDGGAPVYTLGRGTALPASTTKLVTSTAALLTLGPDHVFTTRVVAAPGKPRDGVRRLTLVGGGDPLLERGPTVPPEAGGSPSTAWPYPQRADLTTLADATAKALEKARVSRVELSYDATLFSGPAENPTWEADYVPDAVVSPTSALWVDEGRPLNRYGRVADPTSDAADAYAAALTRAGITVVGAPREARAPRGSTDVASVDSAPLSQIVERILDVSDNEGAEVLLRQVGLATSGTGSIAAGTAGVRRTLEDAGIRFGASVFHDGSGLSRDDRAEPRLLLDVLSLAASPDHPELRSVVTGLPVAGFTGSLADRMDHGDPAGLGRVRAKTGTLESVFTLAGVATGLDGTPMVFALMIDRVPFDDSTLAKVTLDDAAAALGACRCGV